MTVRVAENIVLTPLEDEDADEYAALVETENARLARWLPHIGERRTGEIVRAHLAMVRPRVQERLWMDYAIRVHDAIAGSIGLYDIDRSRRAATIGYWLGERYGGRGIMTRSVCALVGHAFASCAIRRLEIYTAIDNLASRAVAERAGFSLEALLRDRLALPSGRVDAALYVKMVSGDLCDA